MSAGSRAIVIAECLGAWACQLRGATALHRHPLSIVPMWKVGREPDSAKHVALPVPRRPVREHRRERKGLHSRGGLAYYCLASTKS